MKALALVPLCLLSAQEPDLAREYRERIRPLVATYCAGCHSTKDKKGDLDLERFGALDDIRKDARPWLHVVEQIETGEMPPNKKPQPTDAEKTALIRWTRAMLDAEARARAGDPGPLIPRRLSNAEYTYTLRDLTGVGTLQPAREFPADGAAGEGFTNAAQALVMSPALVAKYLDAAKGVAAHAVLLPDGIRFSPGTTRRDWINETLDRIRAVYREFTETRAADRVNLQGIVFDTNDGGRLPLEKYLAATLAERDALASGARTPADVARARGLNARYLGLLWEALNDRRPAFLLDGLRARWRESKESDAGAIATDIAAWQKTLWTFNTVGHIGKVGGPKRWMEPMSPVTARQELRLKPPPPARGAEDVVFYLVAGDAGDGPEGDVVVWSRPRLTAPGRPDLPLRDVGHVARVLAERRAEIFASAPAYLEAAHEAAVSEGAAGLEALAARHGVEVDALKAWLDLLGIGSGGPFKIESHLTEPIQKAGNYDFIRGWGKSETPNVLANSSDRLVRVPGNMKPRSVAVHPSPKLQAVVGWRGPAAGPARVEARIAHAHPECGNGVTWALELRRGSILKRLASGVVQGAKEAKAGPFEALALRAGDLLALRVGPRNRDHACDLTSVELSVAAPGRTWSLAEDVAPDILAGNPRADRFGNPAVWHFFTEPVQDEPDTAPVLPAGSLLDRWLAAGSAGERRALARELPALLAAPPADGPDGALARLLSSRSGPLLRDLRRAPPPAAESADLRVQAPSVTEIRVPADLADGTEFVATGTLDAGAEGSVQLQILTSRPDRVRLIPGEAKIAPGKGPWTSGGKNIVLSAPIVAPEGGAARARVEAGFDAHRRLFPAALCYSKIVPVDEVVTLTLFHREDDHLARLMLDEAGAARLDRLWDELRYVSQDALTLVDAFQQLWEYATQDADPKVFEPLREPIQARAAAFRRRLVETEPRHVEAVVDFAARAWRRPLSAEEGAGLRSLYARLRKEELAHEEAVRLVLARVLVSPAFLYRSETPGPASAAGPLGDVELATRLSYFLWSSTPDEELLRAAMDGRLRDPEALAAQARRMLGDPRARRLATEFACQWLHLYDFDQFDEKSERHFPAFAGLRGAMYEETILFFADLFARNGSLLEILDADHAFLNEELARFYGIPGVSGSGWRRVDGLKRHGRGGILGQASLLAKQSGASRTSPILRGNWVSEVLLGEKLPKPPKDVPPLPAEEDVDALTVRQMVEKHGKDPSCAVCHRRIDGFGFSLEGFDAIGRRRDKDAAGRPIDAKATAPDGAALDGAEGLRAWLLAARRDAVVKQFCRKLLGYALGRATRLSDQPLIEEMLAALKARDYGVQAAVEAVVRSRPFREIRGRDAARDD